MCIDNKQQQIMVNVQEKANLIWAIPDKLVGVYKPHEYGNVILPMCVIKRFEDMQAPTREKLLETNRELEEKKIEMKRGFLERAARQKFYNLSCFTFNTLLADADNIKDNNESYLNHFSENVSWNSRFSPLAPMWKSSLQRLLKTKLEKNSIKIEKIIFLRKMAAQERLNFRVLSSC